MTIHQVTVSIKYSESWKYFASPFAAVSAANMMIRGALPDALKNYDGVTKATAEVEGKHITIRPIKVHA